MRKNWKWIVSMLAVISMSTAFMACDSLMESSTADSSTMDSSTADSSTMDSSTMDSSVAETKYTVTFKADNEVVKTETYTDEDMTIDEPEVPTKEHYTGEWEEYTLDGNDITVNAVYTPIEYTIVFKVNDEEVGSDTYTVEDTEIEIPTVPAKEHYTGAWESYALTGGEVIVAAIYTPIDYTITFMNNEETVEEVVFNIESTDKQAPAVPDKTGYTGAWGVYDFSKYENQTVTVEYEPNTYQITYVTNGGTVTETVQEVVFDNEYTLAEAIPGKSYQEFLGWVDEAGNAMTDGAEWKIASNVTLTAVYSDVMTFEKATAVPSSLRASNHAGTATIGEKDGDKCLVIPVTGSTPYLMVTRAFLAEFFEDPNVEYVAFDAKTETLTTDNFRRYTMKADGSGMHYVHYEAQHDINEFATLDGVSSETWKSFYFSRADYNHWVEKDIEENTLIYATGFSSGDKIYVDNVRPVTAQEYLDGQYGFDAGWVRLNGTNLLVYNSLGTIKQWQLGIGFDAEANKPTAFGLTNDLASNGSRALSFTKPAGTGDYTVRLNDGAFTAMKSTGYYAFDLYVPEGADTTLIGISGWTVATPKASGWMTVYVSNTNNKPVKIHDTTGGTYAIDYFRSVTAEEYNAAMYGFELGAGALRDVTESENRVYYYAGADEHTTKKVSLNVKGDGSTISNVRMDSENVHSGDYALAFEKTDGYAYMSMSTESTMYAALKDGFTFWIYSTVALNGTGDAKNFINGYGEQFGNEGVLIPANTWVQVTITAEDINDSGRFLIIQGSTAGTIYLDDFCPLPKSAE